MRHLYLVSYDISNPKRLQQVMKTVNDFGDRLQLSVFLCQLTDKDLAVLKNRLTDKINHKQDQVVFVNLGTATEQTQETRLDCLGRSIDVRDLKVMIY